MYKIVNHQYPDIDHFSLEVMAEDHSFYTSTTFMSSSELRVDENPFLIKLYTLINILECIQ